MHLHIIPPIKLLPALWTNMSLLSMNMSVRRKVAGLSETRPASLADMFPQSLVFQNVLVQKRLRRILVIANSTSVRFWIAVLEDVGLVLGSDLESLAADLASVRGHVTSFNVFIEHRQTRVQVITEATSEISFVLHVNTSDVTQQPRAKREDLAAILASEILRRQMTFNVHLQRHLVVVTLVAVGALVGFDSLVDVVVLGEIKLGPEALGTFGTSHGTGIGVRAPDVFHHVGLADETSLTDDAGELFDSKMGFYVNGAFVSTFVHFSTELAGVTCLVVDNDWFDIVVNVDFFTVDFEEVFWILSDDVLLLDGFGFVVSSAVF